MLEKILTFILGSKHKSDLKELLPIVKKINNLELQAISLSDQEIKEYTAKLRQRYQDGEKLDAMLPEAFALAREGARRVLGERMFDVQLMGGIVLHKGRIMEMKTGEGKTLSCVPAAYLNALTGEGVHIVTVNDYLAKRDASWMGRVYNFLGISVGVITSEMDPQTRQKEYKQDITYGTNNEFGFDYLRDNLKWDNDTKAQRKHNYCIVDEIDSILIDEARTPLIISGPAEDDTRQYYEVNRLVPGLKECAKDPATGDYPETTEGDYKLEEKNKRIMFTDQGMNTIEQLLLKRGLIQGTLFSSDNFEYVHYFTQCLKAHILFKIDVDYIVQDNKVQIVDEFTGRVLYGRRYSDGLHQAIEAKERIRIEQRNRTLATITFQNYFRMYNKISGMTGTADTEAKEFSKIYNLDVTVIPTNRPVVRQDNDDLIFLTEADKVKVICDDIAEHNKKGQPILVGTVSIEKSELIAQALTRRGVRHEVLNAKNHAREALIIAEAGSKGAVTIATNMAGRGTDIKLGGNPEYRATRRAGTDATEEVYKQCYDKEYEKWQKDYAEVKSLGGLYVLGTERHEARRIDNQLRGRSGRQGDPGLSQFYICMDDTLMRLFGGDNMKSLMGNLGMKDGDPINHPWINKSIEKAQSRVEERNFETRKHLLEYDDVLNEQRKFIYSRRDEILEDHDLVARVTSAIEELVDQCLERYLEAKENNSPRAFTILLDELKDNFLYIPKLPFSEMTAMTMDQIRASIVADISQDLETKKNNLGQDNLNRFIKEEYMRNVDNRWQDHLEALDALKEAVYLRAYSQKNPLLEYKLEGFHIFDTMLSDIRLAIARKVAKIQILALNGNNLILERIAKGSASHRVLGQFSATSSANTATGAVSGERNEAQGPVKMQVKRSQPKVGRNDPCPCGSGKKYKTCCGKDS